MDIKSHYMVTIQLSKNECFQIPCHLFTHGYTRIYCFQMHSIWFLLAWWHVDETNMILSFDPLQAFFGCANQPMMSSGIILCMHPANERRCYNVTSSLIGWVHAHNNPCIMTVLDVLVANRCQAISIHPNLQFCCWWWVHLLTQIIPHVLTAFWQLANWL